MQALKDNVFFKRDDKPSRSPSGLIELPPQVGENSMFGVAVAVGPDVKSGIVVGDRALIGKVGGQTVRYLGEDLVVVKDANVLAIVEQGEGE